MENSKDADEEHEMHSSNDFIELLIFGKTDEAIKQIFGSLLKRCRIGLETSIRSTDFFFDCVNLLHRKCHKINLKCDDHV